MAQVLLDERRNEVIAMVMARLQAQRNKVSRFIGGLFKRARHELTLEKIVALPLVD